MASSWSSPRSDMDSPLVAGMVFHAHSLGDSSGVPVFSEDIGSLRRALRPGSLRPSVRSGASTPASGRSSPSGPARRRSSLPPGSPPMADLRLRSGSMHDLLPVPSPYLLRDRRSALSECHTMPASQTLPPSLRAEWLGFDHAMGEFAVEFPPAPPGVAATKENRRTFLGRARRLFGRFKIGGSSPGAKEK